VGVAGNGVARSVFFFISDSPIEPANRGDFHSGELLRCQRIIFVHEPQVLFTSKMRLAPRISSALNNRSRIQMTDSGFAALSRRSG